MSDSFAMGILARKPETRALPRLESKVVKTLLNIHKSRKMTHGTKIHLRASEREKEETRKNGWAKIKRAPHDDGGTEQQMLLQQMWR